MKIHAHILAWNEEKILPFTLDYYSEICTKIYIYDNMSTDTSDKIYKKYPKVSVIKWNSNDQIHEMNYLNIKNQAYKKYSRNKNVDWVIVCDCDEFLYHPDLINKLKELKNLGIDVPGIDGRDMVSEEFPIYDGSKITEIVQSGSKTYEPMCKKIIFNPNIDMSFGLGAHSSTCTNCKTSNNYDLMLLHYKFLGLDYVKDRYRTLNSRLSEWNKKVGAGSHYTDRNAISYHEELMTNKVKIIL